MPPWRRHPALLPILALSALIVLAWFAYAPGLSGGFLFDDYANLPTLGDFGRIDNATALLRYLTSGAADPTGRPLSLATFLIDARNWPADPSPFKRTNLIIHLVNGALLAALLLRLGRALETRGGEARRTQATRWAAVLGAGLWILHPLFLSTTLYIVQREAMLPATFTLIGLLGYLAGRERVIEGRRGGSALALASVLTCTVLALLCKANGALLPWFALILEYGLLTPQRPVPHAAEHFRRVRRFVVVLPSVLLAAWLVFVGIKSSIVGLGMQRPWTEGERLLSESRAVVEYLSLLWFPRPYSRGLFNDAFAVSHGLFSPPSTLLSIVLIAALLGFALGNRRRYPAATTAVLFFLGGHVLESTVVPLELYFEHRNYVPSLLMFWPLALWLCSPDRSAERTGARSESRLLGRIRLALAFALPVVLAGLTHVGAGLWGDVHDQALVWAARNPDSPRAQAYAAQVEMARGKVQPAIARLRKALAAHPDEIQLALNLLDAECESGMQPELGRAETALAQSRRLGHLAYDWISSRLSTRGAASCQALDLDAMRALVDAMASNPLTREPGGRRQDVLSLRARVALSAGDAAAALDYFNAAFDAYPTPSSAMQQVATLAGAGHPQLALSHLQHFEEAKNHLERQPIGMPRVHAWLLEREHYWDHEADRLRRLLEEDMRHTSGADAGGGPRGDCSRKLASCDDERLRVRAPSLVIRTAPYSRGTA